MCVLRNEDLVMENLDLPDLIAKRFANGPYRKYRDEVRQIAALALVEARDKLPVAHPNPRAFFFQRMKWRVRDWHRDLPRHSAPTECFPDNEPVSPANTEDETIHARLLVAVLAAIDQLPDRCAIVVKLRFGVDCTALRYREVAQLLNMNVNTVKGVQMQAVRLLAEKLREWM